MTKAENRGNRDYEASATVTFPNAGDGIRETQSPKEAANSVFKWPREAPEAGYQPKLEVHRRLKSTSEPGQSVNINTAGEQQRHFFGSSGFCVGKAG